jgi:hypothetical protein
MSAYRTALILHCSAQKARGLFAYVEPKVKPVHAGNSRYVGNSRGKKVPVAAARAVFEGQTGY